MLGNMITSNPCDFSSLAKHCVFPPVKVWKQSDSNRRLINHHIKTYLHAYLIVNQQLWPYNVVHCSFSYYISNTVKKIHVEKLLCGTSVARPVGSHRAGFAYL